MAVTVGGFVGGSYSATNSPSFTFPTSPVEDDVIVVYVGSAGSATLDGGVEPATWDNALGAGTVVTPGDGSVFLVVLHHTVTAAEDTANTTSWTLTDLWTNAESGDFVACYLRGADTADVVDAFGSISNAGNTNPQTLPAVTGTDIASTGGLVLRGIVKDSTGTYTTPGGHTEVVTSGVGTWLGTRDTTASAGVNVDAVDITVSAADEYVAASVVITPAATGEEHSTTGTVSLALVTDGGVAKTAETAGGIGLALTVADDAVKLAEVVGALALGTTIDADVAKIAAATGAMALALEIAGDVDKMAAVAGSLGLVLDLSGVADADSSIENTVGTLALALAIAATATKTANTTGTLPVTLGVTGIVDKEAATVGAIGLQVAVTGQTAKTVATIGALPLVLTLAGLVDFVPPFVVGTTTATARGATTTATVVRITTTAATIAPSTTATEIAA